MQFHRQLRNMIPEYTLKLAAPSLICGLLTIIITAPAGTKHKHKEHSNSLKYCAGPCIHIYIYTITDKMQC